MWPRLFLSVSVSAAFLLAPANVSVERGGALFQGQEALSGRIRGQDEALPPEVVRCVNCHGAASSGNRVSRVVAPHLDSALLLEFRQRRGGPPSRYDQPAFCKLLRTGVDPAKILIAREMPTYDLDEPQCVSLWSFVLAKDNEAKR